MAQKYKYISVTKRKDGVAVVRIDCPGETINSLSPAMGVDFQKMMDEVETDARIKAAVLISAKPGNFIVGADINVFTKIKTAAEGEQIIHTSHALFNRIENCQKPFVAAIDGMCMGGGLELTLACAYRIATQSPKTQFAFPEVKLGIFPAGGGTQRIPRMIGLVNGLDILISGRTVYGPEAKKLGLINDLVIPYSLEEQAITAALSLISGETSKSNRKRSLGQQATEDFAPARDMVLNKAREQVMKKTKGHYPGPLAVLDCVKTGMEQGMTAGLAKEAELFGKLVVAPVVQELINLFFAVTAKKKHPLAKGAPAISKVGVLGAGLMGAGIGLVSIQNAKIPVLLKDINEEAVARGIKYIYKQIDKRFQKKAIGRVDRDRIMTLVNGVTDYSGFNKVDLVVEAVFEDLEIKQKVLADFEAAARKDCVFASNTSALPIHKISKKCKRPENVLGMHYFSPVHKMPLLEIITTEKTSEHALKMAVALGVRQGKTVIVVKDGPGFYTTRILAPYLNETGLLLSEGATMEAIDAACVSFGFPVGAVTLIDEIGIDVIAHVAENLDKNLFSKRGVKADLGVPKMAAAGYLGRKTQKGFFNYDTGQKGKSIPFFSAKKKKKTPNPEIYDFFGGNRQEMDREIIANRMAFVFINEAALCLQEQIIASPTDGDLGAILGLGFPPFLGGPFRFIDSYGVKKLVKHMERYTDKFGAQFSPARILVDHAKTGKKFHK